MAHEFRVGAVPVEKTSAAGNSNAGSHFEILSSGRPVSWMQACWDGEVIKGIAIRFHGDGAIHGVADWNNRSSERFHRSAMEFAEDDVLKSFSISTSAFGYVSVRGLIVQTRAQQQLQQTWTPGNITDTPSYLNVADRVLMGIYGNANPDNFINALGLWVTKR